MSNFQPPYQKIAWLQRRLDALESMVRKVITPAGIVSSGTTTIVSPVGVIATHDHTGTGQGGTPPTDKQGANIASSATIQPGVDGYYFHVTGTTAITTILQPGIVTSYSTLILASTPGGYWRLNEASGNAADSSGNANTATANGTITYGVTGAIPGFTAVTPNGTTGYFSAADAGTIDPADTFTVEAWIKRGATQGTSQCIVSKGANAFELRMNTSNQLELLKDNVAVIVASTTTITDTTTWHHVVATKSGSTSKLYIDGVDVTGTVTDSTCATNASALNIGRRPANSEYLSGSIDEVAIYPTALTAAVVLSHYRAAVAQYGAGYRLMLEFDGALTLTNSASLILLGGVNRLTVAGDIMEFVYEGSGVWREINRHYRVKGQGTIANLASSVVITHGAGVTPLLQDIFITLSNNPTTQPGEVWVDTITSTQFTVNCAVALTVGSLTFGWTVFLG